MALPAPNLVTAKSPGAVELQLILVVENVEPFREKELIRRMTNLVSHVVRVCQQFLRVARCVRAYLAYLEPELAYARRWRSQEGAASRERSRYARQRVGERSRMGWTGQRFCHDKRPSPTADTVFLFFVAGRVWVLSLACSTTARYEAAVAIDKPRASWFDEECNAQYFACHGYVLTTIVYPLQGLALADRMPSFCGDTGGISDSSWTPLRFVGE
ncbi:hypothetical protein BU16DRAFT_554091 [Lophium mytilinum]|uniref:Uncharacterized protein n=1 Tax=Lophium mytilinum TaxID=390894 RepID=A0A6A6REZ2_9PEZI|nr:hypothetical protein BU16DRAFT_554091 [Lophium mytilinum]